MFVITSQYGYRKRPNTGKTEFTSGTDIVPQTKDKSVPALAPGKIVNIAVDKYSQGGLLDPSKHKGLGHYIDVELTEGPYAGHTVRYGHLDPIKNKKALLGQTVNTGDTLAGFGVGSGSGTGPHVKVYLIDPKGNKINPNKLLSEAKKTLSSGTTGKNLTELASTSESFSNIDPNNSTKKLAAEQKKQETAMGTPQQSKLSASPQGNITGLSYQGLASPNIYQTNANQLNNQQGALNRQVSSAQTQLAERNAALDADYASKTANTKKSMTSFPVYQTNDPAPTPVKYNTSMNEMGDELAASTNNRLASIKNKSRQQETPYYGLNLGKYFQYG